MGPRRFPLLWSPRSDSLDRCRLMRTVVSFSPPAREKATSAASCSRLAASRLACQASRRRASFEQRSLGQVPRATPDAKVDPQSASP